MKDTNLLEETRETQDTGTGKVFVYKAVDQCGLLKGSVG